MAVKDYSFTAVADGAGAATITIQSQAQTWTITQVSTECSAAPVGAQSRVRKNSSIVSKMLPAGDVASGDPPIVLQREDVMTVTWTGCTPGAVCKATIFFDNGV